MAADAQIAAFGVGLSGEYGSRVADQIRGSARSYLTLSTLATVRHSWDGHPHHRLTMPLQRGLLSLRCGRAARSAGAAPVTSQLDRERSI